MQEELSRVDSLILRKGLKWVLQETKKWTKQEKASFLYQWKFWARPKQLEFMSRRFRKVAIRSGRGFGKTKSGAEWIRDRAEKEPGYYMIVGPTFTDVQETMIEGESGILAVTPYWNQPKYLSSKLKLVYPNGSVIRGFSAKEPDRIRGANIKGIWGDEYGFWPYLLAYKNIRLCLRSGRKTELRLTSTPSYNETVEEVEKEQLAGRFKIIEGSTYENRNNLAGDFLEDIKLFEGSEFGDMEIWGRIPGQRQGAFFSKDSLERVICKELPAIIKKVIYVDPSSSDSRTSDSTGIVVLGQTFDMRVILLGDYSTPSGNPEIYLQKIRQASIEHNCSEIVVERNDGGLTLKHTIKNSGANYKVRTVYNTQTKRIRVQPCIPLFINGMVKLFHRSKELEKQMLTCTFQKPGEEDDIFDAFILGIHDMLPNLVKLKLRTNQTTIKEELANVRR